MPKDKKILIIEDEKSLSQALFDKLERDGFIVIRACNGKIGLEMALEEKPDLILLDIVMPVMDGLTMLQELKKDDWGNKAKVIVLTNLYDSEKVIDCVEQGVTDYLIKTDWKLVDIIEKIKLKLV
jgi:DNA-binding response OmpR family regulator